MLMIRKAGSSITHVLVRDKIRDFCICLLFHTCNQVSLRISHSQTNALVAQNINFIIKEEIIIIKIVLLSLGHISNMTTTLVELGTQGICFVFLCRLLDKDKLDNSYVVNKHQNLLKALYINLLDFVGNMSQKQ